MVVAQIGVASAVLSDSLFGVIVFMSVMTTLIAPPLLNLAYKGVTTVPSKGREVYRIG